ncbi:lysozyme inhibitor LprI family protein [Microvirga terrestris]|uniref:DUF1311 domain-containing protein n=1 Tax=Microvirga terrestris TaxID=2791024 RepID=A0ABS0HP69_9HYPH|nr:lysozyme inhibitor LprI family protein [Microvirga terrestris]MBF9195278.1 DUF1311 domain-containing protein [Microvirga terrestris]
MRPLSIVLLAMLFLSPAARAGDDCKGETQSEMNMCAEHKFEKADKAMNERYTKLMKRLDRDDQGKLRDAQRAWISYRDKVCDFETSGLGSVRPMIFAGCMTMLTELHIRYLDSQLTCEEGDLSCRGWVGNKN